MTFGRSKIDGYFKTVEEMKESNPPVGRLVQTTDYYSTQRGGGASYLIKTVAQAAADGDVIDGYGNHAIDGGLYVAIIRANDANELYWDQFGAVGNSNTSGDESVPIQACVDHCFRNKIKCLGVDGRFITKHPIIVRVSNASSEDHYQTFEGASRLGTFLHKFGNLTLNLPSPYNADAVVIIAPENLDETPVSHAQIGNYTAQSQTGELVEYGTLIPQSANYCKFHDIGCKQVINGFRTEGDNFLNLYHTMRLEQVTNGFTQGAGFNTSNDIVDVWVVASSGTAYRVHGIYINLVNPAADNCSGILYHLGGFRGTVTTPGSESENATRVYYFENPDRQTSTDDAVVTINGCWHKMLTDPSAIAIQSFNGSRITFNGGYINAGGRLQVAPGKLFETSSNGLGSSLIFNGTKSNAWAIQPNTLPENIRTEDLSILNDDVNYDHLKKYSKGYKEWDVTRQNYQYYGVSGNAADAFGNDYDLAQTSVLGFAGVPDDDAESITKSGLYTCSATIANVPSGAAGGLIIASNRYNFVQLILVANNGIYRRRRTSGLVWESWIKTLE